jgi:hypothetical protein
LSTDKFFTEHSISPDVANARPYVRFEKGDLAIVTRANEGFPKEVVRLARTVAGQSGGYIITRRGFPSPKLPPQLRPDNPVYTSNQRIPSYHPLPARYIHTSRGERLAWRKTDKGVKVRSLAPGQIPRHVMNFHGGKELAELRGLEPELLLTNPDLSTELEEIIAACNPNHLHFYRGKAAKYVLPPGDWGKKIDLHPFAWKLIQKAKTVFFVIEGSLKNDSLISIGQASFCVPSVTLWRNPDLRALTHWLRGKRIVIMPDADWCMKPQVIAQAMMCRTYLRSFGLAVCVAAPPLVVDRATGRSRVEVDPVFGELKAIDDYLAAGRDLYNIDVIEREAPAATKVWARLNGDRYRSDRFAGLVTALERLPLHADDSGQVIKSLSSFATILGCGLETARRRIADLVEEGILLLEDGDTAASYQWENEDGLLCDYDWDERPRVTLVEDFRATNRTLKLSEWIGEPPAVTCTQIPRGVSRDQCTTRRTRGSVNDDDLQLAERTLSG